MKSYKLIPYLIHKNEEVAIIQNEQTTCVIKDKTLINFFVENDDKPSFQFTLDDLTKCFGEKAQEFLDFMLQNSLICVDEFKAKAIERVSFFTNSKLIYESLEYNLKGLSISYTVKLFENPQELTKEDFSSDDTVSYFILNPFSYNEYCELESLLKELDVIHKFAFYYNYRFYFTNYHRASWHNPCPLCYFSHLEGSLRAVSKRTNKMSFQTIVDLIYTKMTYFNCEAILDNAKLIPLINEVLLDLKDLNHYTIKCVKNINLSTGVVEYDVATHWEVCSCHDN